MRRRDFLRAGVLTSGGWRVAAQELRRSIPERGSQGLETADVTLNIQPITVELSPKRIIKTIGYNGTSPGPLLKIKEGVPITIKVVNETSEPELVHFHGLFLPGEVDGSEEEGTPPVLPHESRHYTFTPTPAGTHWYHTHSMAMDNLQRGSYTGMFGFLVVEGEHSLGNFDQEQFLALRDWEPFFSDQVMDMDELEPTWGEPERRRRIVDTRLPGLEVMSNTYSINDKALGAGEPIRVKEGHRVLFHFLNASAIEIRHLALPGHSFNVVAMDGTSVPTPTAVEVLMLGPGERIDAWVEMNNPGVWIMGAPENFVRNSGLGVVIEYANRSEDPRWAPPPAFRWDYTLFGKHSLRAEPSERLDMTFDKIPRGAGRLNSFVVNGKAYPHEQEFALKLGTQYRLTLHNRTADSHSFHLHRHHFEIAEIYGKTTFGVIKDTVVVPVFGRASVDFTADQPGLTLFHCHMQQHMDYGLKALLRCV